MFSAPTLLHSAPDQQLQQSLDCIIPSLPIPTPEELIQDLLAHSTEAIDDSEPVGDDSNRGRSTKRKLSESSLHQRSLSRSTSRSLSGSREQEVREGVRNA